jgi:Fur family transcriptional regulator, peroxide stress response regulator
VRFGAILDARSHLYCKDSHEIKDYRNQELERLLQKFIQKNEIEGFEVDEISIVFKGHRKQ